MFQFYLLRVSACWILWHRNKWKVVLTANHRTHSFVSHFPLKTDPKNGVRFSIFVQLSGYNTFSNFRISHFLWAHILPSFLSQRRKQHQYEWGGGGGRGFKKKNRKTWAYIIACAFCTLLVVEVLLVIASLNMGFFHFIFWEMLTALAIIMSIHWHWRHSNKYPQIHLWMLSIYHVNRTKCHQWSNALVYTPQTVLFGHVQVNWRKIQQNASGTLNFSAEKNPLLMRWWQVVLSFNILEHSYAPNVISQFDAFWYFLLCSTAPHFFAIFFHFSRSNRRAIEN